MNPEESQNWQDLVDGYLHGSISTTDFDRLKAELKKDPQKRAYYLRAVRMDAFLREISANSPEEVNAPVARSRTKHFQPSWLAAASGVMASILIGCALAFPFLRPVASARILEMADAQWLSQDWKPGQALHSGQTLTLLSGVATIRFQSGAWTRLQGPSKFQVIAGNEGFLHFGQAFSKAETAASHGFTLHTRLGKFVDQGTEFFASATQDGFSQMHVSAGAVDAKVPGFPLERLEQGSGLGIESGDTPVIIRIESGTGTPDFEFPTIPSPSDVDAADLSQRRSEVTLLGPDGEEISPHRKSGEGKRLIDGVGQSRGDEPGESLYFTDASQGLILLDLGQEIPISRIHTYSWHLNDEYPDFRRRAVQRYTLWGCGGSRPSSLPENDELSAGWTRIARVDTDAFFDVENDPDRPEQQVCAIYSNRPEIGTYRYLLFQVNPTPMPNGMRSRHTFFGEIDVFAVPRNN